MHTKSSLRVVLDTSVVIVLSKLGVLEKALNLFSDVEVPSGVLEELERKKDETYREFMRIVSRGMVHIEDVKKKFPRLGLGESSAILLALMKGKIVVLDDKRARKVARELGLQVIGTLSILKKLHDDGVLTQTPDAVYKRLLETGFYVDKRLFKKIFLEGATD